VLCHFVYTVLIR